jgi:hypothetical protein
MALFRVPHVARRVAAVDAYQFPGGARQRFVQQHPDLANESLRTVEAGARQWFRLAARHPRARLAQPSVAVDGLWRDFVLYTQQYAEFCDAALGRLLPYAPESGLAPAGVTDSKSSGLRATLRMAQEDEGCAADALPVLFRVDKEIALAGGRRYLADCGGRGLCYELKGTVCLEHLGGPGRRPPGSGNWKIKHVKYEADGLSTFGGGCGGG